MKQALRWRLLLVLMAVGVTGSSVQAIPVARLTLHSEPGDFIGQGGEFDLLYNVPSDNVSAQIRRSLPDGSPGELLFVLDSPAPGNQSALLFFGTDQLGIPIQPGEYLDAQRADFADPGHPGLDVSFQNRGSNTLTGSFTVLDVRFTTDLSGGLQIASFDATFEQHSEGADPALFGRLRFNASGLSVPEPATPMLCLMGAMAVARRLGRGLRLDD